MPCTKSVIESRSSTRNSARLVVPKISYLHPGLLAASTVTQRLAALRFFYTRTIRKAWSAAETPYPKKTRHLPSILSPEEVAHLIDSSQTWFHRIVLMTLYGTGGTAC